MNADILLMTLVGLPASGKSYFCSELERNVDETTKIWHVEYDSLHSLLYESQHTAPTADWKDEWINVRQQALLHISYLLDRLLKRTTALEVTAANQKTLQLLLGESDDIDEVIRCKKRHIIVADDNFISRSSRKAVKKLAQTYATAYVELCFRTPLELCVERDSERRKETMVGERTILEMADKMEWPSNDEAFAITADVLSQPKFYDRFLSQAWRTRPKSLDELEVENEKKAKDRKETASSVIYNLDLELRTLLHSRVQSVGDPKEKKVIAQQLGKLKRSLLEEARKEFHEKGVVNSETVKRKMVDYESLA